jgi:hypothetical protein
MKKMPTHMDGWMGGWMSIQFYLWIDRRIWQHTFMDGRMDEHLFSWHIPHG